MSSNRFNTRGEVWLSSVIFINNFSPFTQLWTFQEFSKTFLNVILGSLQFFPYLMSVPDCFCCYIVAVMFLLFRVISRAQKKQQTFSSLKCFEKSERIYYDCAWAKWSELWNTQHLDTLKTLKCFRNVFETIFRNACRKRRRGANYDCY